MNERFVKYSEACLLTQENIFKEKGSGVTAARLNNRKLTFNQLKEWHENIFITVSQRHCHICCCSLTFFTSLFSLLRFYTVFSISLMFVLNWVSCHVCECGLTLSHTVLSRFTHISKGLRVLSSRSGTFLKNTI